MPLSNVRLCAHRKLIFPLPSLIANVPHRTLMSPLMPHSFLASPLPPLLIPPMILVNSFDLQQILALLPCTLSVMSGYMAPFQFACSLHTMTLDEISGFARQLVVVASINTIVCTASDTKSLLLHGDTKKPCAS